ncbi:MAG: alpha/beta fold hydrolase BchO [Gammaproteobacteria bacterium]
MPDAADVLPPDWPNRDASRFVQAGGIRWHVQQMGSGPVLLCLHGTGASTHSWRSLAPLLARRFRVVAPDLPGHGFTTVPRPGALSVAGMAAALGELLTELGVEPQHVVGHSAGAAIGVRMALDGALRPRGIVSLNGAMLPLDGVTGLLFAGAARLLSVAPFASRVLAWHVSRPDVVERLMRDTGSRLDEEGLALYARLARQPDHVAAVFDMMANWDLQPLARDLPRLSCPLLLVVAERDGMVPPSAAVRIRALVPGATLLRLPGLGHLAHEEAPALLAGHIGDFAAEAARHAA